MMGQEVDPIVSTLWRIIHFLDEEERHWSAEHGAARRACWEDLYQNQWEQGHPNLRHDNDVTTSTREGRQRGRSPTRKVRAVISRSEMAAPSSVQPPSQSVGRGRTPSPKRSPAPAPPNPLRCPSPAPKAVSTSEVLPNDQQGWLTDQLRGRRVWCAVADMLFCVFEKPDSKVSKQVLLLPGCKVRQVEFKTASRDNQLVNGVGRKYKSKTISGVDKFQFWIENGTKRQRFMFGVDTKEELEKWIETLTRVASVDPDSIAPEGDSGTEENDQEAESDNRKSGTGSAARRRRVGVLDIASKGATQRSRSKDSATDPRIRRPRADSGGSDVSSDSGGAGGGVCEGVGAYTPAQNLPRRIDFLSMSLSNTRDVGKGSVDDIRKKLRKEQEHATETKATPLKATYVGDEDDSAKSKPTSRRRSFFRVGGFESLFSRTKKRSASADDALKRRALNHGAKPSASTPPSPDASRKDKRKLTRTGSGELTKEEDKGLKREGKAFLSRSWDVEQNSRGLGSSIRRSASDLKSKLFSTSGKSRGPGLRQVDLTDVRLQGHLQYKGRVRWVKVWAVLCRGCFYGFKSERGDETPLLVFVLPQCTVSYLADSSPSSSVATSTTKKKQQQQQPKKQFAFKLSQPHCRSLSLCAENPSDFLAWMQALQLEACKVVAEDDVSSVETDNSSNASADASPAPPGTVTRRRGAGAGTGTAESPRHNGAGPNAKTKAWRSSVASDTGSTHSFDSDESGLATGASTLTSSSSAAGHHHLLAPPVIMTSDSGDVSGGSSPRHLGSADAAKLTHSPRNSSGLTLAEELKRRHGLGLTSGPDGDVDATDGAQNSNLAFFLNPYQHGDNVAGAGDTGSQCSGGSSSTSQPGTPRHDDALTQVWSKDKGYLLQLIRSKVLRRKKRGKPGSKGGDGGGIYNKEMARSHEGGLLIHHDDEDVSRASAAGGGGASGQEEVLLGEVRHRSRSFTEGKTTRAPQPPANYADDNDDSLFPSHPGWNSTPSTPRGWPRDDFGGGGCVGGLTPALSRCDVVETSQPVVSSALLLPPPPPTVPAASSVVRQHHHPRQRRVSSDEFGLDASPRDQGGRGDSEGVSCRQSPRSGDGALLSDLKCSSADAAAATATGSLPPSSSSRVSRNDDGVDVSHDVEVGINEQQCRRDGSPAGRAENDNNEQRLQQTHHHQQHHHQQQQHRVQVSVVEHSRTYSAAWDEYDSQEEAGDSDNTITTTSNNAFANNNNNYDNSKTDSRLSSKDRWHSPAEANDDPAASSWVSLSPHESTVARTLAKTQTDEAAATGVGDSVSGSGLARSGDGKDDTGPEPAASARGHTIPRTRPVSLASYLNPSTSASFNSSSGQGVKNEAHAPSAGASSRSVSDNSNNDPALKYGSGEFLGRKPRGPILTYYQRTRGSSSGSVSESADPSSSGDPGRRTDSLRHQGPTRSAAEPQRSSRQSLAESSRSSVSRSLSAGPGKSSAGLSASHIPAPTASSAAQNRHSTAGVPLQSPRKSSGISQRSRSPSQGRAPVSRKSAASGIPVSSRSASAGPPSTPRSASTAGPPVSPRKTTSTTTTTQASSNQNSSSSAALPQSPRATSETPRTNTTSKIPRAGSGDLSQRSDGGGAADKRREEARGGGKKTPRGSSEGKGKESEKDKKKKEKTSKQPQPMAVMELAARDLQAPVMHGYLLRKTYGDLWVRYWYVLQDGCLYCYLTPDDRVTVDVTDLEGYMVTSLVDKFPGQRFVLHLEYEEYVPVYLSASSREELEDWSAALTSAMKVTPRLNGHGPHPQEDADTSGGPSNSRVSEEKILGIKQKLLAEVLRQKQELEKKQAARLASKGKQPSFEDGDINSSSQGYNPLSANPTPTGEQICTLTRLRQRRMSTQIKMDTLQRQIQSNGHTSKKSRFTFGKKKNSGGDDGPPPAHSPDVVEQLKTLSDHLSAIDRDLVQNGGVMTLDRKFSKGSGGGSGAGYGSSSSSAGMGNRKSTSSSTSRLSQDMEIYESGGGGSGSGGGVGGARSPRASGVEALLSEMAAESAISRSNSLKSSMQKLAHRTFAKAVWYRGKKSSGSQETSVDKDDGDASSYNNNNSGRIPTVTTPPGTEDPAHLSAAAHAPDVIDLSHRLGRTWPRREASQDSFEEGGGDAFLPPPTSFYGGADDSPSPVSSPRSARSAGSTTSSDRVQGHRQQGPALLKGFHDESRLPRRQVDPDAMANIEAFEEMSRQIIGEAPS